jgi:hypothetical protein
MISPWVSSIPLLWSEFNKKIMKLYNFFFMLPCEIPNLFFIYFQFKSPLNSQYHLWNEFEYDLIYIQSLVF